jgi:hypothetical protein
MPIVEVALAEWPEVGGPVVLGRSTDPSIVQQVREHLAAQRRRELARLDPPVRPVPRSPEGSEE